MLANQSDFMAYASALKSNYRKGVHRLETILSNPTMSAEFAANLGGVSVVLGVPISMPDRNSDKLLELLLGSAVADNAVETWLHQFYEFTDWDDLLSDSARCQEMANNPLIWRAAGGSKLAVGKSVATLAGLSCAAYKDIDAVAASQVAMAAVIGNATALNAVVTSSVAMTAIIGNPTALNAVVTSQVAMTAIIGNSTALNAVVTSSVAMAAVAASQVAMAAVAASQVAMTAIIGNSTALNAVVTSSVAMTAIIGNSTALNAVVTSSVAMAAVAASNTATKAIAASQTALNAIAGSITALDALYAKKSRLTGASAAKSGKFIILEISSNCAFDTSQYGYATLSDGSKPDWQDYKSKYAYFKHFKKIATYIKNDTEGDDWIDYFPCG